MEKSTKKSSVRNTILVIIAYFLLTVVMTWPTARHVTGAIPGDGFDGWQNYWNLWWVKQALLVEQTNPYFTRYLDAPTGVSLLFHTLNIFNGLWTLPLQLNFGLAIAYNSVVFVSFALAGYGGYLLALYTLGRLMPRAPGLRAAAFAGGLIFTMSPFHMAHLLGHMQVFSMIWPPFYILWLLRTLEPWRPARPTAPPRLWRNAALGTLFLILATLVDWYHTLYLLLFTGLLLLWMLGRAIATHRGDGSNAVRRQLLRPLLVVAAIGLGFGLVLSPLLLPMVREASSRPDLETGLVQNITLSADLLAFVTPSELHPLWGEWARSIADNFTSTTSERLIFAGFVPLGLALYALASGWRRLAVKFWGLVTLFFVVMALGPYLHIGGEIVRVGQRPLPMPYLLLYHTVPFIDLTRSLSRYDLMVMLGLGVLAAVGLARIQMAGSRYQGAGTYEEQGAGNKYRAATRVWPSLAAVGLICFEFLAVPYPISRIEIPQFYVGIGQQAADYTIAELPLNWDRPTPLLHQTVHGKRLLTAYTSRDNPLELAWRTPVFQHWQNLGPDIIDQPLADIAPTIFFDFNLRYVVLDYWQMPPGPERSGTERWVAAALPGATPVYDDGRLRVYQTPAKTETRPYLTLGAGWEERTVQGEDPGARRFKANQPAELFLHHPQENVMALEITAAASTDGQTLALYADGQPVAMLPLSRQPAPFRFEVPPLAGPLVRLRLAAGAPEGTVLVQRIGLEPFD